MSLFGDVLGGILQGNAAKKAAKVQRQTTQDIIAANDRTRQQLYGLSRPAIDRGNAAGALYGAFLGLPTSKPATGGASGNGGVVDWGGYVAGNPWATEHWNKIKSGQIKFDGDINAFGQYHHDTYGKDWDLTPYTYGGAPAVSSGSDAASALDTYRASTGYQDLLKTGLGAVNASAYARGTGDSGATLKALQAKGMSLADQSAQGWLDNLSNLINAGTAAVGTVGGVAQNTTSANNQALQTAADAKGNAALIKGNAWANIGRSGVDFLAGLGSSFGG